MEPLQVTRWPLAWGLGALTHPAKEVGGGMDRQDEAWFRPNITLALESNLSSLSNSGVLGCLPHEPVCDKLFQLLCIIVSKVCTLWAKGCYLPGQQGRSSTNQYRKRCIVPSSVPLFNKRALLQRTFSYNLFLPLAWTSNQHSRAAPDGQLLQLVVQWSKQELCVCFNFYTKHEMPREEQDGSRQHQLAIRDNFKRISQNLTIAFLAWNWEKLKP